MNFFVVSQIEAHAGSVNDLAFAYPSKQLCVVTCGEDRLIKVYFVIFIILIWLFEIWIYVYIEIYTSTLPVFLGNFMV